jgi:hypothetical protein
MLCTSAPKAAVAVANSDFASDVGRSPEERKVALVELSVVEQRYHAVRRSSPGWRPTPNDEFLLPWRSISAKQPGGLHTKMTEQERTHGHRCGTHHRRAAAARVLPHGPVSIAERLAGQLAVSITRSPRSARLDPGPHQHLRALGVAGGPRRPSVAAAPNLATAKRGDALAVGGRVQRFRRAAHLRERRCMNTQHRTVPRTDEIRGAAQS